MIPFYVQYKAKLLSRKYKAENQDKGSGDFVPKQEVRRYMWKCLKTIKCKQVVHGDNRNSCSASNTCSSGFDYHSS